MSNTKQHLSFAALTDLSEGKLPPVETAAMQQHLTHCQDCSREFNEVSQLIELMRRDTAQDAPRDVIFNTVNLFAARAQATAQPSRLRRLLASLNFDSTFSAPAFGIRSANAAAASERQLIFQAGDYDIDLRLTREADGWQMSGQILSGEEGQLSDDGRVELAGSSAVAQTIINEFCEFVLPAVPSGVYNLRLQTADFEIDIPALDLPA